MARPEQPGMPLHVHLGLRPTGGEWRTRAVATITVAMMILEVAGGLVFGSKALLADGWHMGTHAVALAVAAFAYAYARRNARSERYCFGTGKIGALAGFASASGLAVVAVYLAVASIGQVAAPAAIRFDEAIGVALLGLAVNLASMALLREPAGAERGHRVHEHGFGVHGHVHGEHERAYAAHREPGVRGHRDLNLRGAFLHVAADAITSVAAILALVAGKYLGWTWTDAAMGLAGALLIGRWSIALVRETSAVLLDETNPEVRGALRAAVERATASRVEDLRLWSIGPGRVAAAVSILDEAPQPPDHYRALLEACAPLEYVAVEVNRPRADGVRGA